MYDDKIVITPTEMGELPILEDWSKHSSDYLDSMIYALKALVTERDLVLPLYATSEKNGLGVIKGGKE